MLVDHMIVAITEQKQHNLMVQALVISKLRPTRTSNPTSWRPVGRIPLGEPRLGKESPFDHLDTWFGQAKPRKTEGAEQSF